MHFASWVIEVRIVYLFLVLNENVARTGYAKWNP
jgi:hypothetical protein